MVKAIDDHTLVTAFEYLDTATTDKLSELMSAVGLDPMQDLAFADASGANLSSQNFTGANLEGCRLTAANLDGTDLSGANLRHADLSNASLKKANLSRADLRYASLLNVDLSDTKCEGADFSYASVDERFEWLVAKSFHLASAEASKHTGGHRAPTQPRKATLQLAFLGAEGQGKRTLAEAIHKVLGQTGEITVPLAEILANGANLTFTMRYRQFETDQRRYVQADPISTTKRGVDLIHALAHADVALLVVSGTDGPLPKTREDILLCRRLGVPSIVVFVNKIDLIHDVEILELVELEVRELLTRYEYPGNEVPVVFGSALNALLGNSEVAGSASIRKLIDILDSDVPLPPPADAPFLMAVDDWFQTPDKGIVVFGQVERGRIRVGEELELVGLAPTRQTTAHAIVGLGKAAMDEGCRGDFIGIVLGSLVLADIQRGQVLAKPGSIRPHSHFDASVSLLAPDDSNGPAWWSEPSISIELRGRQYAGRIMLAEDSLGETRSQLPLAVTLEQRLPLELGLSLSIFRATRMVAYGRITNMIR